MLDLLKGLGTEGFILNLVLIGILFYFLKVKPMLMRKQGKDRRNNPSPAPGNASVCKENRDMLIRLKTKMEAVEKKLNKSN